MVPCLVQVNSLHVYHVVCQGTPSRLQPGNQNPPHLQFIIFHPMKWIQRAIKNHSVAMGSGAYCHYKDYSHQCRLLLKHLSTYQIPATWCCWQPLVLSWTQIAALHASSSPSCEVTKNQLVAQVLVHIRFSRHFLKNLRTYRIGNNAIRMCYSTRTVAPKTSMLTGEHLLWIKFEELFEAFTVELENIIQLNGSFIGVNIVVF